MTTECPHCHKHPCECTATQKAYVPPEHDTPERVADEAVNAGWNAWVIERRIRALIDAATKPLHQQILWNEHKHIAVEDVAASASGAEVSACCPGSTSDDDAIAAAKRSHMRSKIAEIAGAVPTPVTKGLTGVWAVGLEEEPDEASTPWPEDPEPNRTGQPVPETIGSWNRRTRLLEAKPDQVIKIAVFISVRGSKRRRCGIGCKARCGDTCDLFNVFSYDAAPLRKSKRHPGEYMRCQACLDATWCGTTTATDATSEVVVERDAIADETERRISCGVFTAGQPSGDCDGDGHYMCKQCALWSGTKSER